MMIEGKKQMAIHVKTDVYLFDIADDIKSMTCGLSEDWKIVIYFTMASFNVKLQNKDVKVDEAVVNFLVETNEAAMFMNGVTKFTRGHIEAIPHLGAVIDHFNDVYLSKKEGFVPVLPPGV